MKNTLQHNNKYKTTYQLIFTSALINIEILNLHLTEPKLSHPLNSRPNCGSPNLRHDDDGDDDDDDDDDDGDSDYVDDDDADVELYRASWRLVMLMITVEMMVLEKIRNTINLLAISSSHRMLHPGVEGGVQKLYPAILNIKMCSNQFKHF